MTSIRSVAALGTSVKIISYTRDTTTLKKGLARVFLLMGKLRHSVSQLLEQTLSEA